jgi:dynein heavy chain
MAIETEINAIASVHNIGALSLETLPLKTSLKSEAASWKAQFAHNLHKQCSEDLKAFDAYIRDTTLKVRIHELLQPVCPQTCQAQCAL